MPTAEAVVPTERAGRYLMQLCRHLNSMSAMRHHLDHHGNGRMPPRVQHVDCSDTYGTVRFTTGLCTLLATADRLTLRLDADDEPTLQRLRDGIARRIENIGRRDHLTVTWQHAHSPSHAAREAPEAASALAPSGPPAGQRRRRGWLSTLGLAALAALIITAHFGMLGGLLAASIVEKWGLALIVALITVKILIAGLHILAGGIALRRGMTPNRPWRWPSKWRPSAQHTNRTRQAAATDTAAHGTLTRQEET